MRSKYVNLLCYVNLKYPRNLGILGSRDRPIPGLFPHTPSKENALGPRLEKCMKTAMKSAHSTDQSRASLDGWS